MRRAFFVLVGAISIALLSGARLAAQDGAPKVAVPMPTPNTLQTPNNGLPGLVVTLALGELEVSGARGDTFTPAARRALDDMKDFLPYKNYRQLDTAWILGLSGRPHIFLNGFNGQKHEFYMAGQSLLPKMIAVHELRLWGSSPTSTVLIDTSFRLALGETIVVGTSRLDGGRALILLVTWAR